jgi:hypothetical protein
MTKVAKSSKAVKEVAEEATGTVANVTVTEPKKLGRPSDPNSARQARLKEMEARKEAMGGYIPLGRPAVEGSKRQIKLAEIAAKKADPNYVPAKGRPKMTEQEKEEARAKREAAKQAWIAAEKAKHGVVTE